MGMLLAIGTMVTRLRFGRVGLKWCATAIVASSVVEVVVGVAAVVVSYLVFLYDREGLEQVVVEDRGFIFSLRNDNLA